MRRSKSSFNLVSSASCAAPGGARIILLSFPRADAPSASSGQALGTCLGEDIIDPRLAPKKRARTWATFQKAGANPSASLRAGSGPPVHLSLILLAAERAGVLGKRRSPAPKMEGGKWRRQTTPATGPCSKG